MKLIPAIDLKDGRCVRLRQGDLDHNITVFNDDPVAQARQWIALGATRIHIVDLDGARSGTGVNAAAVRGILAASAGKAQVELGGGIRSMEDVARWMQAGVTYAVIGTAAVRNPDFVTEAAASWPGRIIVSLDSRDGVVATDGWEKSSGRLAVDVARDLERRGAAAFLYTDIARDGMLTGCNVAATAALADAVRVPVIASGGVRDIHDIEALLQVEARGVAAAILGRSLYEGTLDFAEAQKLVAESASHAG